MQIRVDGLRAFKVQDRRIDPIPNALFQRRRGTDDLHLPF